MSDVPDVTLVSLVQNVDDAVVEAELWDVITDKNLADWEVKWRPALEQKIATLYDKDVRRALWPQSRFWDWRRKIQSIERQLSNQCFAIVCQGMTQAMMITDLTRRAKLPDQKNDHLVYIDFIEAAPWNRSEINGEQPQFSGCGSILIRAAIEFSRLQGYKGRIGLHSLPQANNFYANKIGMTDLGMDPDYENLRYFEMTQEQAEIFTKEGD